MDLLPDMRATLLLSGIEEHIPSSLGLDTIDHEQNPYLSRHFMSHTPMTIRQNSIVTSTNASMTTGFKLAHRRTFNDHHNLYGANTNNLAAEMDEKFLSI